MYHFSLSYSGKDLSLLKALLGAPLGVIKALYNSRNIAYIDSLVLQLPSIRLSLRGVLDD